MSQVSSLKLVPPLHPARPGPPGGSLFSQYGLDNAYDEMFEANWRARPHYGPLIEELLVASQDELRQRQLEADRAFLTQGITFTVYGDDQGTERIFPFDLLPRIITSREWDTLERGLAQRLTAINLFLKDIYHEGRILAERRRAAGARLQLPALPARNARRQGSQGHLRLDRRHRSHSSRRRPLRRARGQPARAERRLVHARQSRGHQARISGSLHALQREADRALRPSAAGHAANAHTRQPASRPSWSSHRAWATRRTSSTPSSPARWAFRSSKGATSSSTTTSSTCGQRPDCDAWT